MIFNVYLMRIKLDKEKCIGCGTCVALAPKTFQFSEDGKVDVKPGEGDDQDTVEMAASACPVAAIVVEK